MTARQDRPLTGGTHQVGALLSGDLHAAGRSYQAGAATMVETEGDPGGAVSSGWGMIRTSTRKCPAGPGRCRGSLDRRTRNPGPSMAPP